MTASNYNFSANPPTVDVDGSLIFSDNSSSQPGAYLNAARLPDGGSFSTQFTVDDKTNVRGGILISDDTSWPPTNGYWFVVEGANVGFTLDRARMLSWTAGVFNYDAGIENSNVLNLINGQTYTLTLTRAGDVFSFLVDSTVYLTFKQPDRKVGEEPNVGLQVAFRSAQRTYRLKPLPSGPGTGSGTVSSAVPTDAQIILRRSGHPGFVVANVGSSTFAASPVARELLPVVLSGSQIKVAGTGVTVPAGTGLVASVTGIATPGVVVGFSEPATDANMPLWDGVTLAGRSSTTVDPVTRTFKMTPLTSSGYAYRTKQAYDHLSDVTLEFYATLEQIIGTSAWLGAVFHVAEAYSPPYFNYYGLNVNRDVAFPSGGQVISALYGDEKGNNRAPYVTNLGEEHHHRLVYDAANQRVLWYLDGVFRSSAPWIAFGPVHGWLGSVSQTGTPVVPDQQGRATFRDVRIYGTPTATISATTPPSPASSFTAVAPNASRINLGWVAGSAGLPILTRAPAFPTGGAPKLTAGQTSFADLLVTAGTTYTYSLGYASEGGVSTPVTVSATPT